ncbi:MAG TPA: PEF-CTERM sorting domain-containing protein [Candidatus Syntrophoarchaeum butanivorans]|uniref:PEF-CTERM sorting domain-containing protein n=1 Tax=Candidatus Syntropharchaeum butanivorans TaxID=1839936 RepID=A0A7C0X5A6_9EURY|nr:PEF-CTERM sorting domain-containing protein [Candidatus Syntrophoarchaeum butanivorans]
MNWDETVHLSVTDPRSGWSYTFSENDFNLSLFGSKTVEMLITVAPDASSGDYYHDAKAEGKVFGITVEETIYTNVLTKVTPEFSTIAIPVVAILGLVFLFNRRKY